MPVCGCQEKSLLLAKLFENQGSARWGGQFSSPIGLTSGLISGGTYFRWGLTRASSLERGRRRNPQRRIAFGFQDDGVSYDFGKVDSLRMGSICRVTDDGLVVIEMSHQEIFAPWPMQLSIEA